jgi:hypothetical protein
MTMKTGRWKAYTKVWAASRTRPPTFWARRGSQACPITTRTTARNLALSK